MKYRIANTVVQIEIAEKFMHPKFKPFLCEQDAEPDLLCYVAVLEDVREAIQITIGQLALVADNRMSVFEGALGIDMIYPKHKYLTSISVNREQTEAQIYVVQDRAGEWTGEFYEALQDVVLLAMEKKGTFALDASSLLCDGKAVLLSKDPDAQMAKLCVEQGIGELLHETMTICGREEEEFFAYGTPWSDTTHVSGEKVSLGGIVFLKGSEGKQILQLAEDKRLLFMIVRCISPLWREGLLDLCLGSIQTMEPSLWIRQVLVPQDKEGAQYLSDRIAEVFGGVRLF